MTTIQRLDLAERFLDVGRFTACLRVVEPLTGRAPRTSADLRAHRLQARAAYGLGRMRLAESSATAVLRRRPKDAETMRLLVRVLQREGRHRDAATWMATLDELGTNTWDDDSAMPVPRPHRPRHHAA